MRLTTQMLLVQMPLEEQQTLDQNTRYKGWIKSSGNTVIIQLTNK